MNKLGNWAVIDIETTGANHQEDEIIDIGFLQFEGTQLVKKYSSLVNTRKELSHFIQKLTGIKPSQIKTAPSLEKIKHEIDVLEDHYLIAHNSDFEKSFLEPCFNFKGEETVKYRDSIYYLGLLNLEHSSLNLEQFIRFYKIADKEEHRGLSDSMDLLKVLLTSTYKTHKDGTDREILKNYFYKYKLEDEWFFAFYSLEEDELKDIASHIEFDLDEQLEKILSSLKDIEEKEEDNKENFSTQFSGENIKNILRSESELHEKIPGYRFREPQEKFSMRVGQSFKNKVHSIIQAPTGTGKTLGYLLPSVLYGLETKEQVLIATGTKTLQSQAQLKDVPQLRKMLGLGNDKLKIANLIGSGNHLCELIFRKKVEEDSMYLSTLSFKQKFSHLYLDYLFTFNYHNEDKKLHRGDIPYVLKRKLDGEEELEKLQTETSVDFRACFGFKCPHFKSCSYTQGIAKAKEADVIIGNHSLMFSWPKGFERPLKIVVDEAHKLEKEATDAFSVSVKESDLEIFVRSLESNQALGSLYFLLGKGNNNKEIISQKINQIRDEVNDLKEILKENLSLVKDTIELYFKQRNYYTDLYWNESPMIFESDLNNDLKVKIRNYLESISFVLSQIIEKLAPYFDMWDSNQLSDENMLMALGRFEKFKSTLMDLSSNLEMNLKENDQYGQVLKYHQSFGFECLSQPIDVGKVIHENLLISSDSVVFTSATLGNVDGSKGSGGVEWVNGYHYLEPERRFKSPFYLEPVYDYKNNSKVFICDDTLPFKDYQFIPEVINKIVPLIKKLGGRSLLLFSSKVRFEEAREKLIKEFEGKIPLFIQGMGNNIVEEFKNGPAGILLGMESFGEGIDIPGESLQFIFIDKIPDLRNDIVTKKRRDFYQSHFGNEFVDYFLANRTRSLQQKLGRLIRSDKDYGGIIVVDSRIKSWKPRTRKDFIDLMEPYQINLTPFNQAIDEVYEFINSKNSD